MDGSLLLEDSSSVPIGMHYVKVDREKVTRVFMDFGTLFLLDDIIFCKPVSTFFQMPLS